MLKRSFKRLYWRISDVCELTGLDQQTLRNWEQDFKQLRPRRDSSGVRVYRERELRLVILLNELVVEDKQDIAEVRRFLIDNKKELKDLLDAIDLDALTEETDERLAPTSTVEAEPAKEKASVAEPEPPTESEKEQDEAPADEASVEETAVEEPERAEAPEVIEEPEHEIEEEAEPVEAVEAVEEAEPIVETEPVDVEEVAEAEQTLEMEPIEAEQAPPAEEPAAEKPHAEDLPVDIPPEPVEAVAAVEEAETRDEMPPAEELPADIPPEPVETAPAEAAVEMDELAVEEQPITAPEPEESAVFEAEPILNTRFALRFIDIADEDVAKLSEQVEQAEPEAAQPLPDVDLPCEPTDVRFALSVVRRDLIEELAVVSPIVAEEIAPEPMTPLEQIDAEEPVEVFGALGALHRETEPVEPEPPPSEPLPSIHVEEPVDVQELELGEEPAPEVETARKIPGVDYVGVDYVAVDYVDAELLPILDAAEPVDLPPTPVATEPPVETNGPLAVLDADEPVDLSPSPSIAEQPVEKPTPLAAIDADEPVDIHPALTTPPPESAETPREEPSYEPIPSLVADEPVDVLSAIVALSVPPAPDELVPNDLAIGEFAEPLPVLDAAEPVDLPRRIHVPVPEAVPLPLDAVDTDEPVDVLAALSVPASRAVAMMADVVVDEAPPVEIDARFALAYITPAALTPEPITPQPTYAPLEDIAADEPVDVLSALATTPTTEPVPVAAEPVAPPDTRFALTFIISTEPEQVPEPVFEALETISAAEPVTVLDADSATEIAPPEELPDESSEVAIDERFALAFITPAPSEIEPEPTPEPVFEPLRDVSADEPIAVLAALTQPLPTTQHEAFSEEPLIDEEPPGIDERFSLAYVTVALDPEPEREPEPAYEPLAEVAADEPVDVLEPAVAPPPTPIVEPVSDRLPDWAAEELRLLRNDFVTLLEALDADLGADKIPEERANADADADDDTPKEGV